MTRKSQTSSLRAFAGPVAEEVFGSPEKECDLCGGRQFEVINRRDRKGNHLDTAVCVRCGMVAHLHVPSDEELAEFYAHHYREEYHGESTPSARRVVRAWRNGERIYQQLAHYVKPGDSVFEVGAGIGCNVQVFQERGCQASGIEPGEGFSQYSREKLRANIARCDLMDVPPLPRHDLVLLVHVIEHLNSPTRALTRIGKLLKPGGRLYVECPNLAAPFARPSRMFHVAHIHNFTPRTLTMLAEKCGFSVEARFGGDDDPNLQMLLRRWPQGRLQIDPESYRCTLESLSRYNALSYHLRLGYLWPRAKKLASYAEEHLLGSHYERQIVARCAALPDQSEDIQIRRAA